MKKKLSLLFVLFTFVIFSQSKETCSSPEEETLLDLNSITKCTVKSSKKSNNKRARQIEVKVSAPKKRYLKRRTVLKNEASGVSLDASGVSNTVTEDAITKSIELRNQIANLTNTMSASEVRAAEKFMSVDRLPVFKDCKNASKEEESDCFNTEMIKHISKHFSYPSEALLRKIEGNVWVRFVIDANGVVTNIKAIGPDKGELLELEAKRVASKLPKFIPATKKEKTVAVKYGFPINFSIE